MEEDWGQFVDLDILENNHYIFKNNKYKKYKFYSPLKKIEELKEPETVPKEETTNQNEEKILVKIPIPFIKKNMAIQIKKKLLFIHFTLTFTSVFALIFYLS